MKPSRDSRTWDTAVALPRELRFSVKAHHTEINGVCYHCSDAVVFTGSSDGSVKVWDTASGKAKSSLRGGQPIISVDSFENLVAGGGTDKTVRLWDVRTERLVTTYTGHNNKVATASIPFAQWE